MKVIAILLSTCNIRVLRGYLSLIHSSLLCSGFCAVLSVSLFSNCVAVIINPFQLSSHPAVIGLPNVINWYELVIDISFVFCVNSMIIFQA